ncbi:MAG: diaminopimelate decarboxylase [Myxococcota bacterium]|nr:diaminopimelate decarboxylase [Myxococcota bacterium]
MPPTRTIDGRLCLGGVDLASLADQVGTPSYVYDIDGIAAEARALHEGFEGATHLVAYAMKANTAGAVVRALAREGCGADVVSAAELLVALACDIIPERIVYSGVAKQDGEIDRAIACGIGAIQIESIEEIVRVEQRASALGRSVRVSVRVNPSVELAHATHAHVATGHDAAKFGVRREDVPAAISLIEGSPTLKLVGMATHVGSQFMSLEPYVEGARVLLDLVRGLRDAGRARSLAFVDTGGGFGFHYGETVAGGSSTTTCPEPAIPPPRPAEWVRATRAEQRARRLDDLTLYVEPGRALVAAHGVLVARVVQTKVTTATRWLMIDAGMNDLLRPALYQARHRIVPLRTLDAQAESVVWRVVGPVCESSDDFGEQMLPSKPIQAVAILDTGAYGYTMASHYNGRQLPVEVFVAGGRAVGRTQRASVDSWVDDRVNAGS